MCKYFDTRTGNSFLTKEKKFSLMNENRERASLKEARYKFATQMSVKKNGVSGREGGGELLINLGLRNRILIAIVRTPHGQFRLSLPFSNRSFLFLGYKSFSHSCVIASRRKKKNLIAIEVRITQRVRGGQKR